jgi:pimeloyl-ACP methyl ester carboxylesterase
MMTTQAPPSAIKAPVLALSGERDHIHPPATVVQVAERLGGDFRVMKDMSHWLIAEPGWEAVAETCLGWLEEKGALAP